MTPARGTLAAPLESLSESRISVLYPARRAKETKDMALAKKLAEIGQSLKIEMARIHRTLTADWTKKVAVLLDRSKSAQSELAELVAYTEKSAKKTMVFTLALEAVSNVLALAKKVL